MRLMCNLVPSKLYPSTRFCPRRNPGGVELQQLHKPTFSAPTSKHGVEHHIGTKGPPVYARARRLDPVKLAVAEAEFAHMEQVPPGLRSAGYVFIRRDAHRSPLQPPYDGPFRVLEHGAKHLVVDIGDRDDQPPAVTLLSSSCSELKSNHKVTLVCLIRDFYPPILSVAWKRNGKVIDKASHLDEPIESTGPQGVGLFSCTARLSISEKDWVRGGSYSCAVTHRNLTQPLDKTITAPEGVSLRQSLQTIKLSITLLLCKSLFYCCLINILQVLKLQKKQI
ncbi:hypothetical protein SKAU_G00031890 [Synaphobranchus kaupii]|uniref:Ig-like domain-containing protein n=1 Tax=Synaphobranchus kaupii TaxID=118154 RepID=A0A9Q1GDT4_SYNKA|nr:hypothetical protein SKAU_G00031890 [Synaphobranchus kaupii]